VQGLARVQLDGKWGYVNKQGKLVIEPQYDMAEDLRAGLMHVRMGKDWQYLNRSAQPVWPRE
jgi:hypothetical protein